MLSMQIEYNKKRVNKNQQALFPLNVLPVMSSLLMKISKS